MHHFADHRRQPPPGPHPGNYLPSHPPPSHPPPSHPPPSHPPPSHSRSPYGNVEPNRHDSHHELRHKPRNETRHEPRNEPRQLERPIKQDPYFSQSEVGGLRREHESETEWGLRRDFLERNCSELPRDDLLCMASAYVNVEMMGNRYPKPVQDRLMELSTGLNEDYRQKKQSRNEVLFVQASEAKAAEKRKLSEGTRRPPQAPTSAPKKYINFARSTDESDKHYSETAADRKGRSPNAPSNQPTNPPPLMSDLPPNHRRDDRRPFSGIGRRSPSPPYFGGGGGRRSPSPRSFRLSGRRSPSPPSFCGGTGRRSPSPPSSSNLSRLASEVRVPSPRTYPSSENNGRPDNLQSRLLELASSSDAGVGHKLQKGGAKPRTNNGGSGGARGGAFGGFGQMRVAPVVNNVDDSVELNHDASTLLGQHFDTANASPRSRDDEERGRENGEYRSAGNAWTNGKDPGMGPSVIGFRQRHSTFLEKKMADLVYIMKTTKSKVLMNPHGEIGNICVREKLKFSIRCINSYKKLEQTQVFGKWNKSKKPLEFDVHVFELAIEDVAIFICEERSKPKAKANCLREAVEKLAACNYLKVEKEKGRDTLCTWENWRDAPEGAFRYDFLCKASAKFTGAGLNKITANPQKPKGDISQLVILENENRDGRPDVSPSMVLQQSVAFCNMNLRMEHDKKDTAQRRGLSSLHACRIFIEEVLIAEGAAPNVNVSKQVAAAKALEKLKKLCPTLIKKSIQSSNPDVVYSEVARAPKADISTGIAADNPGLKMMLKMGWGGGGLGAEEEGIQEPVNVDEQIVDRQGLGFRQANGISNEFLQRVRKVLEDFNRSGTKERLVFSRGFTNDERKEIHNLVRRCGLKSKSAGKEHHRQLMVWRKKGSVQELIQHMIQSGGDTDLYKLIPPEWCLRGERPPHLEDL